MFGLRGWQYIVEKLVQPFLKGEEKLDSVKPRSEKISRNDFSRYPSKEFYFLKWQIQQIWTVSRNGFSTKESLLNGHFFVKPRRR